MRHGFLANDERWPVGVALTYTTYINLKIPRNIGQNKELLGP